MKLCGWSVFVIILFSIRGNNCSYTPNTQLLDEVINQIISKSILQILGNKSFLIIDVNGACFPEFVYVAEAKKCFYISPTTTSGWEFDWECRVRTNLTGGTAEVRDNATREYLSPLLISMFSFL